MRKRSGRAPARRRSFGRAARPAIAAAVLAVAVALAGEARAQQTSVGDLTILENEVPVRVAGYGLVVGLDGAGDRVIGGFSSGHTVRSVANLLRQFDIEVPERLLRTRNVAAVLVTAEITPYLRPGGRFAVEVASIGDATSLRGGVLWMTPLLDRVGGTPVATAQGPLLIENEGASGASRRRPVETSARIPDGGLLEQPLARSGFAESSRLLLRRPELVTATRIATAVNEALGADVASVEDPGSIALDLAAAEAPRASVLAEISALPVSPSRAARVIIDGGDGTVVAGGDLQVGEAVVSHGGLTLSIRPAEPEESPVPGDVRLSEGVSVQEVAAALHGVAAPASAIGAVFESLNAVGALPAEVVVR